MADCKTQNCPDTDKLLGAGLKAFVNFDNTVTSGSTRYQLGHIKDYTSESQSESQTIKWLNGCESKKYKDAGKFQIKLKYYDNDLTALNTMFGGLFNFTEFDGVSPVTGYQQILDIGSWSNVAGNNNKAVILNVRNASNALVTLNSVTGSSTGVLTLGTDYTATVNEDGFTVIEWIGSIATSQTITIDYTATPPEGYFMQLNKTCSYAKIFNLKIEICGGNCAECTKIIEMFERCSADFTSITPVDVDADTGAYREITIDGFLSRSRLETC